MHKLICDRCGKEAVGDGGVVGGWSTMTQFSKFSSEEQGEAGIDPAPKVDPEPSAVIKGDMVHAITKHYPPVKPKRNHWDFCDSCTEAILLAKIE